MVIPWMINTAEASGDDLSVAAELNPIPEQRHRALAKWLPVDF